jgi:hypothetical protein
MRILKYTNTFPGTRLAAVQQAAIQRAKDDADSWSDGEATGDGGDPVPLVAL